MFSDYVFKIAYGNKVNRILIYDKGEISRNNYSAVFYEHGYKLIIYENDLSFRVNYASILNDPSVKILLFAETSQFIPYDIMRSFTTIDMDYNHLFPKLNSKALADYDIDLDLLTLAYNGVYEDLSSAKATISFIDTVVYSTENVNKHCQVLSKLLSMFARNVQSYADWYRIAEIKAHIDVYCAQFHLPDMTSSVNEPFKAFILNDFGKLAGNLNADTPVIISKTMDFIQLQSKKFVIVVMDGMSEFDWEILSSSFGDIVFQRSAMFAMIPTITSISRQCLLSNKYPRDLLNPWTQSKEKNEFISCAKELGFTDPQIGYERGYDAEFGLLVKCGAIIINEIDDLVHAQHYGKEGMYNDVRYISKLHKLTDLCKRMLSQGFDVYVTADHGNTLCKGVGKLTRTGIETETKSHRMVVLNSYADKESLKSRYNLFEYPKYYLDKEYDYLICENGISLDNKNETVMTHGGISIEEVIVPFITMKWRDNNGKNDRV